MQVNGVDRRRTLIVVVCPEAHEQTSAEDGVSKTAARVKSWTFDTMPRPSTSAGHLLHLANDPFLRRTDVQTQSQCSMDVISSCHDTDLE